MILLWCVKGCQHSIRTPTCPLERHIFSKVDPVIRNIDLDINNIELTIDKTE
jgi:hypothetical protein